MTDLNNSNADEEHPNATSNDGADDLDAAWAEFTQSHADDLKAVEQSRNAKRFEKHAQRREKEALLSINDLDHGTFTDDIPQGRGPRDFTGSSWLDTDNVMDRYGDDFVPPNPKIGHIEAGVLGIAGRRRGRHHPLGIRAGIGRDSGIDFRRVRAGRRRRPDCAAQGPCTDAH